MTLTTALVSLAKESTALALGFVAAAVITLNFESPLFQDKESTEFKIAFVAISLVFFVIFKLGTAFIEFLKQAFLFQLKTRQAVRGKILKLDSITLHERLLLESLAAKSRVSTIELPDEFVEFLKELHNKSLIKIQYQGSAGAYREKTSYRYEIDPQIFLEVTKPK